MRCLWLEDGRLQLRTDVQAPIPGGDDVLVRVSRAGICGTDIALAEGLYAFNGILGHEFVGVVSDGPERLLGRRVVGEVNIACARCAFCLRGMKKHCVQRKALGIRSHNGAFAEYLVLPADNLHLVPETISDDAAVFTEPLAAALDVVEQVEISESERVLVVGDGRLGQLVCRVLALTGARVDVVGRHPRKLEKLAGIAAGAFVEGEFRARDYDVAVECSGKAGGLRVALDSIRSRGTLVLKSTFAYAAKIDMGKIVVEEIRIIGSRCGPFEKALALLESGRVDPLSLIDERYSLDDALRAFERSRKSGMLKLLIDVG
ncbi:MAG: alcohol dehydrogenase catalytic domain-containing protein [Gammaproteobacteria bacterium]|nr:alcohol dehydrogenase catalytic domain-containing protein [Gammaproteobacteria bacterium]